MNSTLSIADHMLLRLSPADTRRVRMVCGVVAALLLVLILHSTSDAEPSDCEKVLP